MKADINHSHQLELSKALRIPPSEICKSGGILSRIELEIVRTQPIKLNL